MARNKSLIVQTPPLNNNSPNVELKPNEFDSLVNNKGYDVVYEKAIKCPCRSAGSGNHQLSGCKNCGGSGWVFINPTKTRMVLQSMNLNTQYKEWSEEKLGTVSITSREVDRISFMDRITIENAQTEYNELVHIKDFDNKKVGFTFYNISDISAAFLFVDQGQPLRLLENITDYTFSYNRLILSSEFAGQENLTVAIRYKHKPQFHVIDISRDILNSPTSNDKGYREELPFPFNAIGRRAHYVLDQENFSGGRVIDNSFDACVTELDKYVKLIQNSESEDIFNSLTDAQKAELLTLLS